MGILWVAALLAAGCALKPSPAEPAGAAGESGDGGSESGSAGHGGATAGGHGAGEGGAPTAGESGAGQGQLVAGRGGEPPVGDAGSDGGGDGCEPIPMADACSGLECGPAEDGCGYFYGCGECLDPQTFCDEPTGACQPTAVCDCSGKTCGFMAGCLEYTVCGDLDGACPAGNYCSSDQTCFPSTGNCEPFVGCCLQHASVNCRQTFRSGCDLHAVDVSNGEQCGMCAEDDGTVSRCGPGF